MHRVGITGHRKLLTNSSKVHLNVLRILEGIKTNCLSTGSPVEVNSGMALGFDQLVCEVCLELGLPYVAVIPCDNQDALWKPEQKERYSRLVSMANKTVLVNPGPYQAWKMHARNAWIVKNSDQMIVHWNGFYQGGTGGCMKLVNSAKLNWVNTL
jgi:uncharacterized phage-like protein YoqJ